MIARIIRFSLEHRLFVLPAALAVLVLGYLAYERLSIDVFPDASPSLIQVFTEADGMAPEEVERLVSYPLESAMSGLPRVRTIRSLSTFALSIVSVYFEDGTDIYWARQLVAQRLVEAREELPAQAGHAQLGPIATGLGLVYLYAIEGEDAPLMDVRTAQDWIVRFELKAIPEVTEVLSFGGASSSSTSSSTPGPSSSTASRSPTWPRRSGSTTRMSARASSPGGPRNTSSGASACSAAWTTCGGSSSPPWPGHPST